MRKTLAALLLICAPIALGLFALLDWAGRVEQATRADDAVAAMVSFVQRQPVFVATALLFALGWFLATDVRLPPVWRAIRGQIGLRFEPREPWVRNHQTSNIQLPGGATVHPPVRFFRAELVAPYHGAAKECRVYLLNVERLVDGEFRETAYDGTQPLRWANSTDDIFGPRDATASRRLFFDVLSVDPFYNAIKVKWPTPEWYAYQDIFSAPGAFRLTLSATTNNSGDSQLRLILLWTGQWDLTEMLTEGRLAPREIEQMFKRQCAAAYESSREVASGLGPP